MLALLCTDIYVVTVRYLAGSNGRTSFLDHRVSDLVAGTSVPVSGTNPDTQRRRKLQLYAEYVLRTANSVGYQRMGGHKPISRDPDIQPNQYPSYQLLTANTNRADTL